MKDQSVLFMARNDDSYSEQLHDHLRRRFSSVTAIWSEGFGSKLHPDILTWCGDYIFCFRSHYILKQPLLQNAKIAAINFHPGPPEYRGSGCVNWALFNGAESYGCTAHLMSMEVDSGAILGIRRFYVDQSDSLEVVLNRTYLNMLLEAFDIVDTLYTSGSDGLENLKSANRSVQWSGPVRRMKDLDRLYEASPDISESELRRLIRATKIGEWAPYIKIHNKIFKLTDSYS